MGVGKWVERLERMERSGKNKGLVNVIPKGWLERSMEHPGIWILKNAPKKKQKSVFSALHGTRSTQLGFRTFGENPDGGFLAS